MLMSLGGINRRRMSSYFWVSERGHCQAIFHEARVWCSASPSPWIHPHIHYRRVPNHWRRFGSKGGAWPMLKHWVLAGALDFIPGKCFINFAWSDFNISAFPSTAKNQQWTRVFTPCFRSTVFQHVKASSRALSRCSESWTLHTIRHEVIESNSALFFGDYYINLWCRRNVDELQSFKAAHCTLSSNRHFCMSKHTRLKSANPTLATVKLDASIIVSNNSCMILWAGAMVLMLKPWNGPCGYSQYNALANNFRIALLIIKAIQII